MLVYSSSKLREDFRQKNTHGKMPRCRVPTDRHDRVGGKWANQRYEILVLLSMKYLWANASNSTEHRTDTESK